MATSDSPAKARPPAASEEDESPTKPPGYLAMTQSRRRGSFSGTLPGGRRGSFSGPAGGEAAEDERQPSIGKIRLQCLLREAASGVIDPIAARGFDLTQMKLPPDQRSPAVVRALVDLRRAAPAVGVRLGLVS